MGAGQNFQASMNSLLRRFEQLQRPSMFQRQLNNARKKLKAVPRGRRGILRMTSPSKKKKSVSFRNTLNRFNKNKGYS